MNTTFYRGQVTKWDDNRGFGFIKSDDQTSATFVHISAFDRSLRRPVVGDIVTYQLAKGADGRIQAVQVSIEGVSFRKQQRPSQSHSRISGLDIAKGTATLLLLLVIGIGFIFIQSNSPSTSPPFLVSLRKPGCVIKGNISINSGNKIYHLPGMEDYPSTVIDPGKGEKWFCTEDEALSQGWKRAPR